MSRLYCYHKAFYPLLWQQKLSHMPEKTLKRGSPHVWIQQRIGGKPESSPQDWACVLVGVWGGVTMWFSLEWTQCVQTRRFITRLCLWSFWSFVKLSFEGGEFSLGTPGQTRTQHTFTSLTSKLLQRFLNGFAWRCVRVCVCVVGRE